MNDQAVMHQDWASRAAHRLDRLTKPPGSLGMLETLAVRLCTIQRTLAPRAERAALLLFAADHGLAHEGVSAYPRAVTAQMVLNLLAGSAAASVLTRLQGCRLCVIDAGVDADFDPHPLLTCGKVAHGTANILHGPAMSPEQCSAALSLGRGVTLRAHREGAEIVLLGEMGIGNTAISALLLSQLTGWPLERCVGPGTGLDAEGVHRKREVLERVLLRHEGRNASGAAPARAKGMLERFGGFEIAALTGAILAAHELGVAVVVDGFTVSVAAALAARIDARSLESCVFAHRSAEPAHRALLEWLGVTPLLDLGMRLGEGTGALVALPLLRAATAVIGGMATFDEAGVSERSDGAS